MKDGIYNRAVNLPAELFAPFLRSNLRLTYSRHAKLECVRDRYNLINPPVLVDIRPEHVVEIEVLAGRPVKAVVRMPYDGSCDLVLVIHPDGFVRTLWLNRRTDNHSSLKTAHLVS